MKSRQSLKKSKKMTTSILRSLRNISKSYAAYRVAFTAAVKGPAVTIKYVTCCLENKYVAF